MSVDSHCIRLKAAPQEQKHTLVTIFCWTKVNSCVKCKLYALTQQVGKNLALTVYELL